MSQTIFALSSGGLPSGVAIIRLSGPQAIEVGQLLSGKTPAARQAVLTNFTDPQSSKILDTGLILVFPNPNSFTGEDVVELHCHGGVATVAIILEALEKQQGCRPAEAGEFSRRAFENGRIDLTGLEGLSDLIAAQTESQRRLALSQSGGSLRKLYDGWRDDLIRSRALIEAELDFSDEEDVPGSVSDQVWDTVFNLQNSIAEHLDDNRSGELIRDGFKIALLGPPNVGKSSLLNALAKRDVAIVTSQAGTTRDVIEVSLNINDHLVIISDTAGLRDTKDIVEQEGIKRAKKAAKSSDLVFWLHDENLSAPPIDIEFVALRTKIDQSPDSDVKDMLTVSTKTDDGLRKLLKYITKQLNNHTISGDDAVVTRQRHRIALQETTVHLVGALGKHLPIELRSEQLRRAADALGRITGRIDVEDLLDVIFSEFCIGK